jgi:hypothetical protein
MREGGASVLLPIQRSEARYFTMDLYLRFGTRSKDLEAAKSIICELLDIAMELRDSSYWGGDYYLARAGQSFAKSIKLHSNTDLHDQKPIFPEYAEFGALLHCDCVSDERILKERLDASSFEFIGRTEV